MHKTMTPQTNQPPLILSREDRDRLLDLAAASIDRIPDVAQRLLEEADRAAVAPADALPDDVVAMGCFVEFRDESSGELRQVQLVYPAEANISEGRVSVLTLIGAALIGLRVGQSISWPTRRGEERRLTVLRVARAALRAAP